MAEKSLTDKLHDLHNLYKSGALTEEEYNSLKEKIISGEKSLNTYKPDDNTPSKRKWVTWVISTTVLFICILFLTVFLFPRLKGTTNNNTTIAFETWDETIARSIIMDELKKDNNWNFPCPYDYDKNELEHSFNEFNNMTINNREIYVVLVSTSLSGYCPPCCSNMISVFEFENKNGWQLYQKAIGFVNTRGVAEIKLYKTGTGNYGISVKDEYGGGRAEEDKPSTTLSKYTFVNKELMEE